MRRLLSAAREGKVPIIWTQVKYDREDMADAGLFYLKAKVLDVWKEGTILSLSTTYHSNK